MVITVNDAFLLNSFYCDAIEQNNSASGENNCKRRKKKKGREKGANSKTHASLMQFYGKKSKKKKTRRKKKRKCEPKKGTILLSNLFPRDSRNVLRSLEWHRKEQKKKKKQGRKANVKQWQRR